MEILKNLGVDGTFWIQLAFFLISYFFLSTFLFKPYKKNLEFRRKNTTAAVDEAHQLVATTERMALEYAGQIKKQNDEALGLYNKMKAEGTVEESRLLEAARTNAEQTLADSNSRISQEIRKTREQLKSILPEMSKLAANKLLGRDV